MNPKTKILIAIDWYRPAHKAGGPITSIENLVDLLGDEPHLEFYVICGVFDYGEQQPLDVPQETWFKVEKAQVPYLAPQTIGLEAVDAHLSNATTRYHPYARTLESEIFHIATARCAAI
jgi:hypothetical protein